jgi:alpha-glucuronidase
LGEHFSIWEKKMAKKTLTGTSDPGYSCWLGYRALENPESISEYRKIGKNIIASQNTVTMNVAVEELRRGLKAMLSVRPVVSKEPQGEGFVLLGFLDKSFEYGNMVEQDEKRKINDEGFMIKTGEKDGRPFILIIGKTDKGVLYGVYSLLRMIQTGQSVRELNRIENPANPLRMLNHWDNMEGKIERGYAGDSIFFRSNRFRSNRRRIRDYARLLASVGLNGTAISNVNVRN